MYFSYERVRVTSGEPTRPIMHARAPETTEVPRNEEQNKHLIKLTARDTKRKKILRDRRTQNYILIPTIINDMMRKKMIIAGTTARQPTDHTLRIPCHRTPLPAYPTPTTPLLPTLGHLILYSMFYLSEGQCGVRKEKQGVRKKERGKEGGNWSGSWINK